MKLEAEVMLVPGLGKRAGGLEMMTTPAKSEDPSSTLEQGIFRRKFAIKTDVFEQKIKEHK